MNVSRWQKFDIVSDYVYGWEMWRKVGNMPILIAGNNSECVINININYKMLYLCL